MRAGQAVEILLQTGLLALGSVYARAAATPGAEQIIAESVKASKADWQAYPEYDYFRREQDPGGHSRTYRVSMIDGWPYDRLIKVDGEPLPKHQEAQEAAKFQAEVRRRHSESARARAKKVNEYDRGRRRDHRMLQALTQALQFQLRGTGNLNGHAVYILDAKPRRGYQPPDQDTKVLTGMVGTLWIDQKTFQWVKAEAHVVQPVSIMGFLAKVEPGTQFKLEKAPVAPDLWMPSRFQMHSDAKILGLFTTTNSENDTFFGYSRADAGYQKTAKGGSAPAVQVKPASAIPSPGN